MSVDAKIIESAIMAGFSLDKEEDFVVTIPQFVKFVKDFALDAIHDNSIQTQLLS